LISTSIVLVLFSFFRAHAQTPGDYFPCHLGDVWQYRSLYTGKLIRTASCDSISTDSSGVIYIRIRNAASGSTYSTYYRRDTANNIYGDFQPQYPRYKLSADSGDSWFAGYASPDSSQYFRISVSRVYQSTVYGVSTTIKEFRFEIVYDMGISWLGNDHLASGFGLVQTDIEPSDTYYLSGAIIDTNHYGVIDEVREDVTLPEGLSLEQNYPNPFNSQTTIRFSVLRREAITLTIFDVLGRKIVGLVEAYATSGIHAVTFRMDHLPSGTYFYRLQTQNRSLTKRMLYLK
jgi:hypothetical protein